LSAGQCFRNIACSSSP